MGLLSSQYLVTLSLAMSRRQPGPCRAAGPFLEGQSRRSQGVTRLSRDTVRRGSESPKWVLSLCIQHLAWAFGDWSSVEMGTFLGLGPLSAAGIRGQEETVTQRKEPACSGMTQIRRVWCPKDNDHRPQSSMFVPQGISNSERQVLLRETS